MASNKYVIIRDDLVLDPLTIMTEGLLIGRLRECELLLNHPSVSRVQAGIRLVEDSYYLFGLRSSNPVILNGKPLEGNQALAAGDVIGVGPFFLEIDRTDEELVIKVSLQIGRESIQADVSSPSLGTVQLSPLMLQEAGKKPAKQRAAPLPGDKALDFFWDKRIREAGKMVRPSRLFPKSQKRSGKTQFNWMPTTDLVSRWPVSLFIWSAVGIGVLSIAAAYWYTNAYAPAPISLAHSKSDLSSPAIAARANNDSCTNCHSLSGNMEANCAGCHNAEAFVATVIEPHVAAGIGCVACHAEHRGANFKPGEAALATCFTCHNDANRNTYLGRQVGTPHGGTFGYPAKDQKWLWEGLNDEDWKLKQIAVERLAGETDDAWRSKQFHALHVERVRAANGIGGNAEGQLSCSSCHKNFNPIDRETPKLTCGNCHNGRIEPGTGRVVIAKDKPNCISCHIQHVKDKRHWNPELMASLQHVQAQ